MSENADHGPNYTIENVKNPIDGGDSETKANREMTQEQKQLESLKSAILNSRPPYYAGTLPLQPEELIIFYGKKDPGSCRRIDFSDVSNVELEHLSNTCDKATFGLNQEDVLDESYRKAGKLDSAYFSSKIDLERSGLMNLVRYNLLKGDASQKPTRAELYKLNVYGKESFFKAHKDTPRSTTMFGSLVLILPTPHEGGALILRHHDKEWTFDSGEEISKSSDPRTYIGYVSFFSDVEHEVTPVKSGYRVTLTYNLYYDSEAVLKAMELTQTLPLNECAVKNVFQGLLEDKDFFPNGVHLGFGLNHEYPIEVKPKDTNLLDFISQNLKGSDAVLMKACKEFKLDARLYVFYARGCYELIVPKAVDLDGQFFWDEDVVGYLRGRHDGKVIKYTEVYKFSDDNDDEIVDFPVEWVTEKTSFNAQRATYGAYGNQPEIAHAYGRFCLIVKVGPPGSRTTVEQTWGVK